MRYALHLICLVATFPFLTNLPAQTSGGLSFYDNRYPADQRTSYNVFEEKQPWARDFVRIQFEMSLEKTSAIGYLLTCKSKDENIFNLVATNYRNEGLKLSLNVSIVKQKLSIPVEERDLNANKWHKVSVMISPEKGFISLGFDNKSDSVSIDSFDGLRLDDCSYVFGVCDHFLDVTSFSIRNLSYNRDNKDVYIFPLTERAGGVVYSSEGEKSGSVTNPNWLSKHHYEWVKVSEFDVTETSAIVYDSVQSKIFLYNYDTVRTLDIRSGNMAALANKLKNRFRFQPGGGGNFIYDAPTSEIFMFNNMTADAYDYTAAKYNLPGNSIQFLGTPHIENRHHHNACWSDRYFRTIYQFGGYGDFKYHNHIHQYDFVSGEWSEASFSGDSITPRFYSAVATDFSGDVDYAYIFGGYGNESGRQEDAGTYYTDLYKLDLTNRTITRIANFACESFDKVPCRDMIMVDGGKSFYTLLYPQYQTTSHARLYKFDIQHGQYLAASDSILFKSTRISTQIHLFKDDPTGKLLCFVQEFDGPQKGKVSIYSLMWPPVSMGDIGNPQPNQGSNNWLLIIVASILFIAVESVIYALRKYRAKEVAVQPDITEDYTADKPCNNSLYLFGDFTVIDRCGRDISYLFSSKIRQLFLLILTNSIRSNPQGITSNEIASILWPEKDPAKSKNIRGVNIKTLREILSQTDGITLLYDNGKWSIGIDSTLCYCDYISVKQRLNGITPEEIANYADIKPYIAALRRGGLLKSENYLWLDSFKSEFEEYLLSICYPLILKAFNNKNYAAAYKFSQVLLMFDPLNDELMRIEVNSLIGMGNPAKAHMKFRQFAVNYYKSYSTNLSYEDYLL